MAADKRSMAPEDLYRIVTAGDAQCSPDGRNVAYVQTRMDEPSDEYRSQIWSVSVDTGESKRITAGSRRDTSPRWSPDGRWLAFLSDREGERKQIWLLPANGGEATKLTDRAAGVESFVWSPQSDRLVFVARVPTVEKTDEKRAATRIISTLKYKLNGEGFTYDRRPHLFVLNVSTHEVRQITGGEFDDHEPAWSPDGSLIAFNSARHVSRETDSISDIHVVPANGGEARQVTLGAGPSHCPTFSPDGTLIAYLGHSDPQAGGAHNFRLWIVPTAGGRSREPVRGLDRTLSTETPPVWSSDGAEVCFGVVDRGTVAIWSVPSAGGQATAVVSGHQLISSWSFASDRSRLAFTASSPADPGDVFVQDLDRPQAQKPRRLTQVNAKWLAEVQLALPEAMNYEGAGGLRIDGWLIKPAGLLPGAKCPLLLNIHGGPHMSYGWGFFDEFQVQAGAGYAVLYTNPRGSQGYGEEFAAACSQDWGGFDFDDVMRGVDHVLGIHDFVDAGSLGVIGGSYGGFMTSWIVGHTNRFAAAVSERAVNALDSMFGTSDIGFWFEQYEVGGTPLEARDRYLERSPLSYAANVTTPLLIVHSEDDLRCPIEQAEQLYVALKLLSRAEVLFVRFPEENHELSRSGRPSRRVERFAIILDWFDHFLGLAGNHAPRNEALGKALSALG